MQEAAHAHVDAGMQAGSAGEAPVGGGGGALRPPGAGPSATESQPVVSTHVLVPEEQVLQLRELSRRTRVAQSEYLREAVDDLLLKYGRGAACAQDGGEG